MVANFRDIVERLGEPQWWMFPLMAPRYETFNPLLFPKSEHGFALLVTGVCTGCGKRYRVGYTASSPNSLPPAYPPYHEVGGSVCNGRLEVVSLDECYELRFGFIWSRYEPAK